MKTRGIFNARQHCKESLFVKARVKQGWYSAAWGGLTRELGDWVYTCAAKPRAQLTVGQSMYFPRLAACFPEDVDWDTCVGVIASLLEEFPLRFAEVKLLAAEFKLFTAPFNFPVNDSLPTWRWNWLSCNATMNWRQSSVPPLHCLTRSRPPFYKFSKIYCTCSL